MKYAVVQVQITIQLPVTTEHKECATTQQATTSTEEYDPRVSMTNVAFPKPNNESGEVQKVNPMASEKTSL